MWLIEARDEETGAIGWGRDWDEARANAGMRPEPNKFEVFRDVVVFDYPCSDDSYSSYVANELCKYFLSDCFRKNREEHLSQTGVNIDEAILDQIHKHLTASEFSSAIRVLIEEVFDGGENF